MMRYWLLFLIVMTWLCAPARGNTPFVRLDSVIAHRNHYNNAKEQKILKIKRKIASATNDSIKLRLYNDVYNEYHFFRFDSAMTYVKKGLELAEKTGKKYYTDLNFIHKASMLASAGLYSEAEEILKSLDERKLGGVGDNSLRYEYNLTLYWLYTYWSDYCSDNEYRTTYWQLKEKYLKRTIDLANDRPNEYNYLMGEYELYVTHNHEKALQFYLKVLESEPANTRLYSTACFAAACCYAHFNNTDKYIEYLVNTAITDIMVPVKENLSLQKLAAWIFDKGNDLKRAENYINVSIEDAKFYNNRLRIIDSSDKLSVIVTKYKDKLNDQNTSLKWTLLGSVVLLILLIATSVAIFKQNKLLSKRKVEIADRNLQLTQLNERLMSLNGELSHKNECLIDTNRKRENLVKLYIDLCSKYIDRLSNYQKLVARKIKAKQVDELLSTITSTRLSEDDAATFLSHFDRAFTDLYPTFVQEFNNLLTEENRISVQHNKLTTELRIFALVRLGVTESSEIANLLFYTPRTIYNYRSVMKSKAINKETFDDDVRRIC